MKSKICTVLFLLSIALDCIQNEERNLHTAALWPGKIHMLEMKANREKRHTALEDMSSSVEAISLEADAEEAPRTLQTFKRQTAITGNGNRLQNLINLPIQLNVLANVLSKLNMGVLDQKSPAAGSNAITGDGNTVSNLVNAPIDVDAVINLLSKVDSSSGGPSKVLGGLLGGGGAGSSDGLLGGLLGGVLGDGGNSGLLSDLLGALLDRDEGLLGGLLNNLLGGVVELVDNLLELVLGLLQALLTGMGNPAGEAPKPGAINSSGCTKCGHTGSSQSATARNLNIQGDNNQVNSLINAPIRINALINILSSLRQQLGQQGMASSGAGSTSIQGNNNQVSSLVNLPVDLDLGLNVLSSVQNTVTGSGGSGSPSSGAPAAGGSGSSGALGNLLGSSGGAGSTSIQGNNNAISSLLNVAPDLNVNANILSQVTTLLARGKASSPGSNPNEICFDIPVQQADTSIRGDNNTISNAINVRPKINLDLNLLSQITQTGGSNVPTERVCFIIPQPPTPPTVQPTTTAPPTTPLPGQRCFRRTCTRWRHFVDYNCSTKPQEYPIYTVTKDI